MIRRSNYPPQILALSLVGILGTMGCGEDEASSSTCDIASTITSLSFGEIRRGNDDNNNPDDFTRVPAEISPVLVASGCEEGTVNVQEVCLVGEGNSAQQFSLEFSPEPPADVSPGQEMIIRVRYDRRDPAGADQVALIVQSDAANQPTLVVPVCGRVVGKDNVNELGDVECQSPIEVMAGERLEDACAMDAM